MKFDYQTYIHAKRNVFTTFFTTVELVSFYSHMGDAIKFISVQRVTHNNFHTIFPNG